MAEDGRPLTGGEIAMLKSVFRSKIDYAKVRVRAHRWFWPLANDRAMAPNGNLYFPGSLYVADFSASTVLLAAKGVFVHEGAHLYQWYGLGWRVWGRGPFDRNYDYRLVAGKAYPAYGLEQMGMIAQDYYLCANGGKATNRQYKLPNFTGLLPVSDR